MRQPGIRREIRSEEFVHHKRLENFQPLKNLIISNETRRLRVRGRRGLQSIWSSQMMASADTRREVRDLKVGTLRSRLGIVESRA